MMFLKFSFDPYPLLLSSLLSDVVLLLYSCDKYIHFGYLNGTLVVKVLPFGLKTIKCLRITV